MEELEEIKIDDGIAPEEPLNIAPVTDDEVTGEITSPDTYSEEEFIAGFRSVFDMSGDITGIQSLKINLENQYDKLGSERAAIRLYDACKRYSALHFLIDRRSGWFSDVVIVGTFAVAKGRAVAEEIGYKPSLSFFEKLRFLWKKDKKAA